MCPELVEPYMNRNMKSPASAKRKRTDNEIAQKIIPETAMSRPAVFPLLSRIFLRARVPNNSPHNATAGSMAIIGRGDMDGDTHEYNIIAIIIATKG